MPRILGIRLLLGCPNSILVLEGASAAVIRHDCRHLTGWDAWSIPMEAFDQGLRRALIKLVCRCI